MKKQVAIFSNHKLKRKFINRISKNKISYKPKKGAQQRLPSKSTFVDFNVCDRRGYLYVYQDYFTGVTESIQKQNLLNKPIFDEGHYIGELAQSLFPNGVEIDYTPGDNIESEVKRTELLTRKIMKKGADVIYEATFFDSGGLCHVDILVRESRFVEELKSHGGNIDRFKTISARSDRWVILEVKSGMHIFKDGVSKQLRDEKRHDVGFQFMVVNQSLKKHKLGEVSAVYYVNPNKDWIKAKDDNIWSYFMLHDVTNEVLDSQLEIKSKFNQMKMLITNEPADIEDLPEAVMGGQCMKPFCSSCSFIDICSGLQDVSYENKFVGDTTYAITKMPMKQKGDWVKAGIKKMTDFINKTPADINIQQLSKLPIRYQQEDQIQKPLVDLMPKSYQNQIKYDAAFMFLNKAKKLDVDQRSLSLFFKEGTLSDRVLKARGAVNIQWPLVAIDFETVNDAYPSYEGASAWQSIPFQVSIVRQQKPGGKYEYGSFPGNIQEFRKLLSRDPRPLIANQLSAFIYDPNIPNYKNSTILAWNSSFEKGRILEMIDWFKQSQYQTRVHKKICEDLQTVLSRLVDVREPFSYGAIYGVGLNGRSSLKVVYPFLYPDAKDQYNDLSIQQGQQAAEQFKVVRAGRGSNQEQDKIMSDLIRYCNFDSEATLKIIERLDYFRRSQNK
ncbi:hypothetical protein DID75_01250 [Candidatus Marinamargulisbacteria bacterium SCGC AG-410-N11]|nr:hypothetical protein DID75_01250 [Candidatus Marinamargulisbacteria bacterium SCGC AG-410-N11]